MTQMGYGRSLVIDGLADRSSYGRTGRRAHGPAHHGAGDRAGRRTLFHIVATGGQ